MKKILLLNMLAIAVCLGSYSQTKKIAHKSHSGKNSEFTINGDDNFGLPPGVKKNPIKKPVNKTDSIKTDSSSKTKVTPPKIIASNRKRKSITRK